MSNGAKRSLFIGAEKGCEKVGKAMEIVVQGRTDMGLMARKRIHPVNGADRAIMTMGSGSITPP